MLLKSFPILVLSAILLCGEPVSAQTYYTYEKPVAEETLHHRAPRVPEYVVFAGDTVRFDRDDLYERMDREFLAFTYMHSTTTLMLKRSKRYFTIVEPILRTYGIPEDLKYLMVIESNLDPRALSSAGAAGLWQFMKSAAKNYGLTVNDEVDERYNVRKETVAACKYMKDARRKVRDWMSVCACYNAGPANIVKRLTDQGVKTALDAFLPAETARYMFRVLACKMLFEDPAAFGFEVTEADMYPYRPPKATVEVDGPVPDLYAFAKEHNTTYFALKEANPWLRSDKLTNMEGQKYEIVIPLW